MNEFNLKNIHELDGVKIGSIIQLICINGKSTKTYSGIYKGIEDDRILIQSVYYPFNDTAIVRFKKSHAIGFEIIRKNFHS